MKKINRKEFVDLLTEELKKSDIIDIAKKDKDFEKAIKNIISDVLVDFFKVLYQHNSIFKNLSK